MMIQVESDSIQDVIIHYVGNFQNGDSLILSNDTIITSLKANNLLASSFISVLNSAKFFHFYHESDIELNEAFVFSRNIFDEKSKFISQSQNFAKHLFSKSTHQKIKGGELCIVYFKNCTFNNSIVDAIGIFKSEQKTPFLRFEKTKESFSIIDLEGVNINKLEKGCLIFNTEKENGYVISVFDGLNNGIEAKYWLDDFLHAKQRDDDYFKTQSMLNLCKKFVIKELPQQIEISKAEQADLLQRTVSYFKENESFDIDNFRNVVMDDHDIVRSFSTFKSDFEKENDSEPINNFSISESAVKKQSRALKSVIKLDKNFHIYIHGSNQFIKKGYDEKTGMSFYQLFFKEEL